MSERSPVPISAFFEDPPSCCIKTKFRYGLASSVFSGNTARAVKIGEAIHCGMTNINDFGVNYLVQVLFHFRRSSR